MSLLDEIRNQPPHVRLVMFFLSVATMISMVGLIWFHSFERQTFALLNPGEDFDQKFLAQNQASQPYSPLALIQNGFNGLRAGIYSLLNLNQGVSSNSSGIKNGYERAHLLPLSADR